MSRPLLSSAARLLAVTLLCSSFGLAGCFQSKPSGKQETSQKDEKKSEGTSGEQTASRENWGPSEDGKSWIGYPDVPYVELMTEVDGIPIPRLNTGAEKLQITGALPVDEGNEYAKKHPGKPTTGDWLIVRFKAEPKSLNPIVETSAVQSYIGQYVGESLAWQNPESLEFEPHIAKKWVAEDSVKLAPSYAGEERTMALDQGEPAGELAVEYPKTADEEDPAVLKITTFGPDGKPLAGVWVGLYPGDDVEGAPATGYHYWSNADGQVDVSDIMSGHYTARTGHEIFGKAEEQEDGSLRVTPATPGNALAEQLKESGEEALVLKKGDWADVQYETVYTYFLRDDVTWSDGKPFTTRDMLFGYAVLNNDYVDGESLRVYYSDLVDCQAVDDHTIRMKYRQQYFKSFEFTMGLSAYSPAFHQFEAYFKDDGKTLTLERLTPEEEKEQNKVSAYGQEFGKFFNTDSRYNNSPLGTGPYIVDKWVQADRVEIRRNPEYWNKERAGHLDRIIFKFIADDVTALAALKAGEIDFAWGLTAEQFFDELDGPPKWFREKFVKASWYSPGFSYYGWNLLKPKFQDRRVRLALSMLFDKKEFLEEKLHNAGVIVAGSQYYFSPFYDHEVKPLDYSRSTAIDLLAEAGWVDTDNDGILDKDGEKMEFELVFPPGSPSAEARAAIVQKSFKEAGIQMEIRRFEWASFIDRVKAKNFDAVNLGWAMPIESDPFQIWHSSGAGPEKRGSNHVSFSNEQADKLIEMLRVTLDEEKRKRIHASFQRILDREQPYMFLYTAKDFGGYHHRFQGVKWYRVRPGFDFSEWYVPKDQQLR
ncbi:MAG: ABC transporter substrate-binding protein [Planctomycetaceae bacterium]|nr:ABC transporter substrate-binding protein [Planctomycetaceae bacterium]